MQEPNNRPSSAGKWVSYRAEIKVLDCTIRDGGLMNNHQFSDDLVRKVFNTCVEAGVDYMELGYKASQRIFADAGAGVWKFCTEDDIRRIVGDTPNSLKLSVMADAERCDYHDDIVPCAQSPLSMIRVATYIHQIPTAIDMIKDACDKGYETTVNLMSVSAVQERDLDEALDLLCQSPVDVIYLVDSFGALYSEQVQYMVKKYLRYAQPAGKQVGMHAHNNLQLAYANTIEAIIQGANMMDATLAGLGRGAGNCQMELLMGFLHNPKYRLRPLLQCIEEDIEPMRAELKWGFDLPYMMTGLMNQHPRSAIKFNEGPDRGRYTRFFDSIEEVE